MIVGESSGDRAYNYILDIKKMLDAQFPDSDSLETVTRYLEMLKEAGLIYRNLIIGL